MKKYNLFIITCIFFALNFSTTTLSDSSLYTTNQSNDLQITFPNGGERVSKNITILWTLASEYINDVNSYDIYYSPNNGHNWIQLAFFYIGTNYYWNTALYETYGTEYLIKIVASSKEWANKEDISASTFTIDNREKNLVSILTAENTNFLGLITSVLVVSSIGIGYYFYNKRLRQVSFTGLFQIDKTTFLKEISHKIIIGLDNIKTSFIDESLNIPPLDTVIAPASIIEYFPSDFQYELRSEIKGRTVLTLIEIAYQDPSDTNPAKIAESLNIPLSTLSKEIKKLKSLNYIQTHVSTQVVQDARYRNFRITFKGFHFLSVLNTALKVTISRVKRNGLIE